VTAAVLGPSFCLDDAAKMIGETPTALLPTVEETISAGIMTATENAFSFWHELLCPRCRRHDPVASAHGAVQSVRPDSGAQRGLEFGHWRCGASEAQGSIWPIAGPSRWPGIAQGTAASAPLPGRGRELKQGGNPA
jgi:hypothetical protein